MPAILNAANEEAVASFLALKIGFLDIARIIAKVCDRLSDENKQNPSLADIINADRLARDAALKATLELDSFGQLFSVR